MEVRSVLKDDILAWHQLISTLRLHLPTRSLNKDAKDDETHTRCRTCAAARAHSALPLFAAFFAISVVVFFAYMCSLYIRKRILTSSFGRELAASGSREETDESEPCVTDTDKLSVTAHDTHLHHSQTLKAPVSDERGFAQSDASPSLEEITATTSKDIPRLSRLQLGTAGKEMDIKRKKSEDVNVDSKTKMLRLEAPIHEIPPRPPPPTLDSDTDSSFDTLLPGIEDAFSEGFWPHDVEAPYTTSSALRVGLAALTEETIGQQRLSPLTQTDWKYPTIAGELSALDESEISTKPLSPFESVLLEASHTSQGLSLEDWLSSSEAAPVGEPPSVTTLSWVPHAIPGSIEESDQVKTSRGLLSAVTSDDQLLSGALSSTETSQSDSFGEVTQHSGKISLRIRATEPSTVPNHGMAASKPESSILRSLLSSVSGGIPIRSSSSRSAGATLQTAGLAKQQSGKEAFRVRVTGPSAALEHEGRRSNSGSSILRSFLSSNSLSSGLPPSSGTTAGVSLLTGAPAAQVSDEVLATHPFYRHPKGQSSLGRKTFSLKNAASYRACHITLGPLLSESRHLLKKLRLTEKELEKLLDYTERLCGYASSLMPAHSGVTTTAFAVETLGRAFLVIDTLHCAAEVVGDGSRKEQWWPAIVHRIENTRYRGGSSGTFIKKACWSSSILSALNAALDYYRVGQRPPMHLVIGVKLAIFLSPKSTVFKNARWDAWRKDAEEWLQSIKLNAEATDQLTEEPGGRRP